MLSEEVILADIEKSLHSCTMVNTESGILKNTNLQCYISHLFYIRTCLSTHHTSDLWLTY